MDWSAIAMASLLIVVIVAFLALLVMALQYWTVTKEVNELKEDYHLSKLECDYAMEQLEEKTAQRVTDQ